jgi:hypothetical protein
MNRRIPLPEPLDSRPFLLRESDGLNVPRGRTVAHDLRTPSRAIRVPLGADLTLLQRCRPYTDVAPDAVISHLTAARIHDFPLPVDFEIPQLLDVARPRGEAVPRRKHVRGRRLRLDEGDVVVLDGVAVTSMARTWLDLASILGVEDLVVIADYLVSEHTRNFGPSRQAKVPLVELHGYIESKTHVPGLAKAREALALTRVGVDSPPESRLRLMLQRAGLPEFRPNYPICDASGYPKVWTDLGCLEFRTCVEYEGGHHLSPEQQSSDHDRDYTTLSLHWHQAKINKTDMKRGDVHVVAKVSRMLERGGWPKASGAA